VYDYSPKPWTSRLQSMRLKNGRRSCGVPVSFVEPRRVGAVRARTMCGARSNHPAVNCKGPGLCICRCVREGKQCVFLEAKPRPKRAKNSRMYHPPSGLAFPSLTISRRVAEMEQKLDSLYALLSSSKEASQDAGQALALPSPPSTIQPELVTSFHIPALPPYHSARSRTEDFAKSFPVFSLPYLVFDDIQDVISKGTVTFERAQESLTLFRTKAAIFPFVVVSPQMSSLDLLRREHPYLLLCILTSTCQDDLKLQNALETEARESMCKKAGVDGAKSLDLLQGALVYLAW